MSSILADRMRGERMFCKECGGKDSRTFNGEMSMQFGGLDGMNKPIVLVYSKVDVCMKCGLAGFKVPEPAIEVLRTGRPIAGAMIVRA